MRKGIMMRGDEDKGITEERGYGGEGIRKRGDKEERGAVVPSSTT